MQYNALSLREYLKEKMSLVVLLFSILASFFSVFLIYDLNISAFITALCVIIFAVLLYFSFDYINYYKVNKKIILSLKNKVYDIDIDSDNASNTNKLLNEIIINQNQEIIELNSDIARIKNDYNEHFSTWVHQIKTPIFALDLLINKLENKDKYLMKTRLLDIENYTNNALYFVRLESKTNDLSFETFSVLDLSKQVAKKFKLFFIEKNLSLKLSSEDMMVLSDKKYLAFILEQILLNALKYTEKGEISIDFDKENKAIIIADTGIGIMAQDLPRIFEKGYTGYNGRMNQKSSGLGLNLVKKACDMLEIKVEVESELAKGSKFSLYI